MRQNRYRRQAGWSLRVLLVLLCSAPALYAQESDSTRLFEIDPVVVTAERSSARLVTSTAAVARISAEELRALPLRSVADALRAVPGITFVDNDGLGSDPQLMLRGFYGGGEAEYVVVLLDGRPLNGLQTGLYNWDLVPLPAVGSIEVVRGASSSLYGDAAVGGVINLVTRGSGEGPSLRGTASAGELGLIEGSLALDTEVGERSASLFGSYRTLDGYREHAGRTSGSAGASVEMIGGEAGRLSLATLHHWRTLEHPGPLSGGELETSRTQFAPFYRFDRTGERFHRLALDGGFGLGAAAELTGYLVGEYHALDQIRTLPLSPDFADTKNRLLNTARLLGSTQVLLRSSRRGAPGQLLLGVDGSWGTADNEYYGISTGDADAYRAGAGARGDLDARGQGDRLAIGAFARSEIRPSQAVRLTAGARVDWLRDAWEPRSPSEGDRTENTHLAFSPRAGVNMRYLSTARQEGHLFASAGGSFKAPTPDQLFDQRSIPVPFEPFRVTISNPELAPQRGTSVEAGLYHRAAVIPDALSGSLSLSVYQIDMRDELDVDLQTFRYVNIGRSRHRGVEAGLDLSVPDGPSAYANYTLQAVTFRRGDYTGNALKAIPRHSLGAGLRMGGDDGLAGSLAAHSAWGIHLDDANTVELPGYTRLDARASYPVFGVRLDLEVFNLLDREYSTTGYLDPAGTGIAYYFPTAGRMVRLGLSVGR